MASERTSAQMGKLGEVRRDPMAMLPFCGYNMGDYFRHWLAMGRRMIQQPRVFHVNWFRADKNGNFLWPGYCENLRVLEWILDRCNNTVEAVPTPIGYLPRAADIDMTGLKLEPQALEELFRIDPVDWLEELKVIKKFFKEFGRNFPDELWQECEELLKRLKS
jgi:phosphoenolpyruvate carboxykinase (GTP)